MKGRQMVHFRVRSGTFFSVVLGMAAVIAMTAACVHAGGNREPTPDSGTASERTPTLELVEVRKIWDRAVHNAFTDLIRFNGEWYCAFREGQAHVSPGGSLRVIASKDGESWRSVALMQSDQADLRDAKLTVTPDNRLMLSGAGAVHQPAEIRHQTYAWFSKDGTTWTDGVPIGEPDLWLWRVTWHRGIAYGIGYSTTGEDFIRLYRSTDGVTFEPLVSQLFVGGYPNETCLEFLEDDTCLCLLRRDGRPNTAQLGTAAPPYTMWSWQNLRMRIGGPNLIRLPDGRLVAGMRRYDDVRTSLAWLRPDEGLMEELLALPSGGDTSYPGLVYHDGLLWVSYYSSHEGKTAIYLAKIAVD